MWAAQSLVLLQVLELIPTVSQALFQHMCRCLTTAVGEEERAQEEEERDAAEGAESIIPSMNWI